MINHVDLEGRLTRPIQISYTSQGKAFTKFTIASDRNYKNRNNEVPTDFVDCELWGRNGRNGQPNNSQVENLKQYTTKGSEISIEGSIQPNSYTNKQGIKVYTQPVVAYVYNFLDSKGTVHRGRGGQMQQSSNPNQPRAKQPKVQDPFATASQSNNKPAQSNNAPATSNSSSSSSSTGTSSGSTTPQSPSNPFANANTSSGNAPTAKSGKKLDISDDDLPF